MGGKMFNKNRTGTMPRKVLEAKRAKAQNRSFEREEKDEYDDEVDTFIKGKDKVSLSRHDEDDEDTVEPVMDLEIPDSDEDLDEDEDDEDDDFKTKMMLKRFGADEDDDNDDQVDDQDVDAMYDNKWGKGKRSYYDTDVKADNKQKLTNKIDFDQQDAEDAEEEEAKRLQKKKASLLSATDFDDDLQVEEEQTLEQKVNKSAKKNSVEQKMLKSVRKDLDAINFDNMADDTTTVVESVKKDISKLSKEEKLELIMNDSPELLTLLEDFKESISEISEKLDPVLSKVKSGEMPTGKGVSYLEVKYHLLLSYCTNISFYLLMKANGKSVKEHPVIDQLVRIRTILERLKPLDKKLSYQINKLLTLAATGSLHVDGKDPRSFRPNPEALEQDDTEDQIEKHVEKKGLYKIPKLQEMHFEEKTTSSQRRKEERERKRAESSQMMKFIRQEYGDEPEEEPNIGADKRNVDPEMKRRAEYEEDMYIRLALTKEDKKKLNRKEREVDELQSLADFGDIAAVTKPQVDPNAILTKKTIKDVIHKIKKDRNEEDNKKRKGVHFGMEEDNDFNDFGIEAADLEDDFVDKSAGSKKKKQKVKLQQQQPQEDTFDYDEEEENQRNPGEKRGINYAIEKNRGLTRHRSRETKTPRTRLRNKYDKAVSKRSGQVRRMADKSRPYGGESTGIKSNLVRSVKLKF